MSIRALGFVLVLSALTSVGLAAETVVLNLVESGIDPASEKQKASEVWEDSLLDAFFDAGHIVSNAAVLGRSSSLLPPTSHGFTEALDGGADYLVVIGLGYDLEKAPYPRMLQFRIMDNRGKIVFVSAALTVSPSEGPKDDERNARKAARDMIDRLKGR
jgi:hypothetical protein